MRVTKGEDEEEYVSGTDREDGSLAVRSSGEGMQKVALELDG